LGRPYPFLEGVLARSLVKLADLHFLDFLFYDEAKSGGPGRPRVQNTGPLYISERVFDGEAELEFPSYPLLSSIMDVAIRNSHALIDRLIPRIPTPLILMRFVNLLFKREGNANRWCRYEQTVRFGIYDYLRREVRAGTAKVAVSVRAGTGVAPQRGRSGGAPLTIYYLRSYFSLSSYCVRLFYSIFYSTIE
jgi:hypothetical protein